ncbi:MAG: PEGA domain-containing protein [Patescibacteria group bacterium]
MKKIRITIFFVSLFIVISAATIGFLYARGFRLDKRSLRIQSNGLLVANSWPNAAEVYVNGELKTATNATISLPPGNYDLEIKKAGFQAWYKRITITKEVVTKVDAFLFPTAASLSPITFSGAISPQISPDFEKIAYAVPNDGLWIIEIVNLPIGFNNEPNQITDGGLDSANWEWSPDSREILLQTQTGTFLLDASTFTRQNSRINVSSKLKKIHQDWQVKRDRKVMSLIAKLEPEIGSIFERKTTDIVFSGDQAKILYTASGSAFFSENVVKQLPGASTQAEERQIKDGQKYIYDIKEDRNFHVVSAETPVFWLANSLNLMIIQKDKILVSEYDATNKQIIYSGAYEFPFAYPSNSLDRLVILTNLGSNTSPPNLYFLSLR